MALKRGATQFEQQYDPHRIGNWELPDTPDSLPRARQGSTRFIANDRGHLLDGAPRSRQSPWTAYRRTDTWEGPRRPAGPHSHSRPGYQNILRPPQSGAAVPDSRETRPKGAVAAHKGDSGQPDPTAGRPEDSDAGGPLRLSVSGSELSSPYSGRSRRSSRAGSPNSAASSRARSGRRVGGGRSEGSDSPASGRGAATAHPSAVSSSQLEELRNLERARRAATASPGDSEDAQQQPVMTAGQFARALRKENFSHWPLVEPLSDAALLAEPRPGELPDRTVAIRPLLHPGPTNCSKNIVVRPRTAPVPEQQTPPAAKPPLLARRPTTALARKIPEIEYALCWNLPPPPPADAPSDSAESADSGDSGVQTPRQAWLGPDCRQLTDRLRQLQQERHEPSPTRLSVDAPPEPAESGYVTPAAVSGRRVPDSPGANRKRAVTAGGSPGSGGTQTGQRDPPDRPARGEEDSVGRGTRGRKTRFEDPEEPDSEGRVIEQSSRAVRPATAAPSADRSGSGSGAPSAQSRVSSGRSTSEESVCTCRLSRAASAPDLLQSSVSTQTAGGGGGRGGGGEGGGCRIDPSRKLRVRPCAACQLYRKPARAVPAVRPEFRAALRAGCANYRPDVKHHVPHSQRQPRIAVRRPDPPPPHRISTLAPPFAMWADRRRHEYPARDRLQTTYGLMTRTALQPKRARSFQSLIYQ